jgi:predicted metal-dependent hydrolase
MKESRAIDVDGIGPVLFEPSSKARRIIITVRPPQGVRVALPRRARLETALDFVAKKKAWIQRQLARLETYKKQNAALSRDFAAMDMEEAGRRLTARLAKLAAEHGFAYRRVSLRRQQTRWGSCSRRNNISLNLKLAVLPADLMDYVILHELVHTRNHDHSRRFWAELDKYVGNGKALAAKLKNFDTRWI